MPIQQMSYDLNLFYAETDTPDPDNAPWCLREDVLTIQPSIYIVEDGRADHHYLESFKLTLEETRAIAPDFPVAEYGEDFFTTLEWFYEEAKTLPERVKHLLAQLPDIEQCELGNAEIKWLHTTKERN